MEIFLYKDFQTSFIEGSKFLVIFIRQLCCCNGILARLLRYNSSHVEKLALKGEVVDNFGDGCADEKTR